MESTSKLICDVCQKKFSSVSTKNRHLKTMHDKKVEEKKSQHIRCPLCLKEKQETFGNHANLIMHLTEVHSVSIKQSDLSIRNIDEFEVRRSKENRDVDYACVRRKPSNGDQYIYYNCNRSNSYGFHSNCTKRAMKAEGSIRISGICPSRTLVKILKNGMVNVKFVETHVGYQDELRTKQLTKQDQAMIADQLHAGVVSKYYFQDQDRIMIWAHCFRTNAGVNTNMAIESLHKILKHNKMNGNQNISIEKLLVRRCRKKIINTERPNANHYQHKITVTAHKKAKEIEDFVELVEFAKFKVKSSADSIMVIQPKHVISYQFTTRKITRACFSDAFFNIHRYNCECPEFTVRTALCKHIHAVVLYERRMNESVTGIFNVGNLGEENLEEALYIQEATMSKIRNQDELCQYLEEKKNETNKPIHFERRQQIALEEVINNTTRIVEKTFEKFMDIFSTFRNNVEREKTQTNKKRKIEKQTYYPNKK